MVGMFQKEVARRIVSDHGSKEYGVISVLAGAYYDREYLFEVGPQSFDPSPSVESAVIRLKRRSLSIGEDEFFRSVVKTAFNQRRKKLSNALATFDLSNIDRAILDLRAEQLSVESFVELSKKIRS